MKPVLLFGCRTGFVFFYSVISDRRDIDFVLYEQLQADQICKEPRFAELNRKVFDMLITEARNFAVKEILPTYAEGDREGVHFENGKVKVPKCFHKAFDLFKEGEWMAMTKPQELGGQGLPHILAQAASEYLIGANYAFCTYMILACGSGKMIELFGTEKQKKLFLRNLYTGKWGGTMLLTESQAGSDLGNLTTSAKKNPDGTYSLIGNKIFITNGEQDLTENIIHPVLARIEGAPKGTKGISLFIVPKFWVNDDGSPGERNDIVCTGVEEKMGIHASPTCSMALGSKGNCRGLLLGAENQGMEIMFHMMNEVRLEVGTQGFCHGTTAYLHALNYARERHQGRDIAAGKDADAPQAPIISHPDVRRMLMWMKSHVDGMRSLLYYAAYLFDKSACARNAADKERYEGLAGLLTPVVKAYCSERGFDVCVQAMQVFGGYGYTREYPAEQILRDCKIASIYEGTDGIQAADLIGRKIGMKKGAALLSLMDEILQTVNRAKETETLADMAAAVESAAKRMGETAVKMSQMLKTPHFRIPFVHALPFLEVMGDVLLSWMLLWRATIAAPKQQTSPFYAGQIKTAAYFINAVLPITMGKMNAIEKGDASAIEIDEKAFG